MNLNRKISYHQWPPGLTDLNLFLIKRVNALLYSHIGVGGCGAHDTRITFRPSDAQMKRYCQTFGWTDKFLKDCFDEVLKLMPIKSSGCGEKFYDAVLSRFCNTNTNNKTFNSIQHYDCTVKPNTIG